MENRILKVENSINPPGSQESGMIEMGSCVSQ
jgi:hypothetical protein